MLSSISTVCRNPAFRGLINQVCGRWIASPRKMECSNFLNFSSSLAHRSEGREDHFSIFSMEAKFDVNEEELVKQFLALQIRWHPDKFASKSQVGIGFFLLSFTKFSTKYCVHGLRRSG